MIYLHVRKIRLLLPENKGNRQIPWWKLIRIYLLIYAKRGQATMQLPYHRQACLRVRALLNLACIMRIGKAKSGNNAIAISQASISLSTSLMEPCLYYKDRQSSASMSVTSHHPVSIWRFRAWPPAAAGVGSARRRQKSRRGRRPERCAAPVQPCLFLPEPPPPGG